MEQTADAEFWIDERPDEDGRVRLELVGELDIAGATRLEERLQALAQGSDPAVLISAFRHQHGEDSVVISAALTRIAQKQANAMAMRDSLDHNALAPFSTRIGGSGFNRAAENIAYGHADFAGTLEQWSNSAGHRANLLLPGAKWIGVAHAQNDHRIYWAMVIGAK